MIKSQQSSGPQIGEVRVTRFRDDVVEQYCKDHPRIIINGIDVPCTPELIHTHFLYQARHGEPDMSAKFKVILAPMIVGTKTFVPIKEPCREEEWVESVGHR